MLTETDLIHTLQSLGPFDGRPVVAHASLRAFGYVRGGAATLVNALCACLPALIMPTHTYKTIITPASGPPGNALNYARGQAWNRFAVPFNPQMPADPLMGVVPEALRLHPGAARSRHPILSFAGLNATQILATQSLQQPFAPLQQLLELDGWVLLLGVDHRSNTTIHLAEKLAGRRQFIRWALTNSGVTECPGFPGCSEGFGALEPALQRYTKTARAGNAILRAVPIQALIEQASLAIINDPLALLCPSDECERCQAIRAPSGERPLATHHSPDD